MYKLFDMSITIRELVSEDRDKLCALFSEFSNYQRDREFWLWINRLLGSDDSIAVVAESNGEIVAHYAIVPQDLLISEVLVKSGIGLHAFIHPEFRGKVLMYKITQLVYELAKKKGIKIVYGFPNANYREIQKRIEGWKQISLFSAYEVKADCFIEHNLNYKLHEFNNAINDLFILDEIIQKAQHSGSVRVFKNLRYYLTRYIEHPQKLYKIKFIYKDDECFGFIVFKTFEKTKGHIVDFIRTKDIEYEDIIKLTVNYFNGKVKSLIFWPIDIGFKSALEELFEYSSGFESFLGLKFLCEEEQQNAKKLLEFNNWELMMGDSDAF